MLEKMEPTAESDTHSVTDAAKPASPKMHITNKVATGIAIGTSAVIGGMSADRELRKGAFKSAISSSNEHFKELKEIQAAYNKTKGDLLKAGKGEARKGWTSETVRTLNKEYRGHVKKWFEEHNLNSYEDYWKLMNDGQRRTAFISVATVVGIVLAAGLSIAKNENLKKLAPGDAEQSQAR